MTLLRGSRRAAGTSKSGRPRGQALAEDVSRHAGRRDTAQAAPRGPAGPPVTRGAQAKRQHDPEQVWSASRDRAGITRSSTGESVRAMRSAAARSSAEIRAARSANPRTERPGDSGLGAPRRRWLLPGRGRPVGTVQGLHKLLLGIVGKRGPQHRPAVRLQRLQELVRSYLADDDQDS